MTPTERQDWMLRAIAGLNAVFPDVMKFENWAVCGQLVPHVQAIATRQEAVALETTAWARLLMCAGYYLKEQGRYSEVEPLYARSLSIREQQLGAVHPTVATSLNNLAGLYQSQGRYSEAEPLYVRSLSIYGQQLGADHPDVAISLNNMAALYRAQGRYSKAEPLYVRSLSIREQQLGANHPDTAGSLFNMAGLYYNMERYSQALPLIQRAVQIYEQALNPDHPTTQAAHSWLQAIREATKE